MPSNYPFKWCLSDWRVQCSVRGWCCIFVQIGCTGAQSCTQAYWLGNLSLPVRETAWARKIQTTGRNPLCLPSSSLTKLTKLIFNVEPSTSKYKYKVRVRRSKTTGHWGCQRNRLSFQPWDLNNLYYNDNSLKMKFSVRINLIPTKPKIVTADWEFMNLEFLLCRQW